MQKLTAKLNKVWDPDTWVGSTKIVTQLHKGNMSQRKPPPTLKKTLHVMSYVMTQKTTPFERFSTISEWMPSAFEETGRGEQ